MSERGIWRGEEFDGHKARMYTLANGDVCIDGECRVQFRPNVMTDICRAWLSRGSDPKTPPESEDK